MKRDVRKKDSSFFTPFLLAKIIFSAIIKSIAIFSVYYIISKLSTVAIAASVGFLTLILLEIVFAYSCRNVKKRVINSNFFSNGYLNRSILLLIIIQFIVFITPIKNIFNIVDIPFTYFLISLIIVIIIFIIDEIFKKVLVKLFKD